MSEVPFVERVLKCVCDPGAALAAVWRRVPIGSFELRSKFDAVERPQYAFGIIQAAKLASALRIGRISVIEFGVAAGDGLLQMEKIAAQVSRFLEVQIDVYGFDRAAGLPMPRDHRDMPYHWTYQSEIHDFRMDPERLRAKLRSAQLVLGEVEETINDFFEAYRPAPIAFVAFDMDLYSSTMSALKLFEAEESNILPRVITYFDETIADGLEMYNDFTGELLAIREFNDGHPSMKLSKINGLFSTRYRRSSWAECVYVMHSFDHPLYDLSLR